MPPEINEDICTRCGKCVDTCTEDVYFGSEPGKVPLVTYPEFCFHCNCCVEECPVQAIKLRVPLPMVLLYKKE
jgi:adenylylsulfate reductase subunit B